jgi:peptidoglycan hydrolase-like protein with peptidoglycan-binding domain
MRRGRTNNNSQVLKLQALLNKHMGTNIPLTGFYGPMTEAGVKAFQEKYAAQILTPWGLTAPTGIAYQTTLRWINLIECPELSLQVPSLVEWSRNPNVNLPAFTGAVTAGL